MSIILDIINERDQKYKEKTQQIFEFIKYKLDKAFQFYMKDSRKIDWFYFELVREIPKFVYIQGYLRANIGEILVFPDGSKTEVTNENYESLRINIVQLLLPLQILEDGGVTEIYARIRDYEQIIKLMSSSEIIDAIIKLNASDLKDILNDDVYVEKITRPKQFLGFDVSNLSKDQMTSLHINADLFNKDKVN